MQKRRKPTNWFLRIFLILVVAGAIYFERFIVPTVPTPFVATPTATRDPESYITEANQAYLEGKLKQAMDAYKIVLQARPKDAIAYLWLARIQVFAGQLKDAKSNAESALLLNANNPTAHAVLGWVLTSQGNFNDAEVSLKRAIELDKDNALAHAYYAVLLTELYLRNQGGLDVVDRMSQESNEAIRLGPDQLEAQYARGYVLEMTASENRLEALKHYEAAIAIHNNLAFLHIAIGRMYVGLEEYDQAVNAFIRANALNPADPLPDYRLSRTYYLVGDYANATQYAEQAVNDDPSNARYHANLGFMYYRNFKYPEAVKELAYFVVGGSLEDGEKIDPVDINDDFYGPTYYYAYGLALARTNQCGEAIQIAQKILTLLPNDEIAAYNTDEMISTCAEGGGEAAASATPEVTPTP